MQHDGLEQGAGNRHSILPIMWGGQGKSRPRGLLTKLRIEAKGIFLAEDWSNDVVLDARNHGTVQYTGRHFIVTLPSAPAVMYWDTGTLSA